jgi:DNA-binding transcriptional LysR family regulator
MDTFEWDDLRYLLAFARAGSMQAAAKALGVNQSTVHRRILVLEQRAGRRLVERHLGSYRMTKLGSDLISSLDEVEAAVAAFGRRLAASDKELTGTVRVTCGSNLAARLRNTPLIDTFHDRHSGLRLELVISDRFLDLSKGEADVAIRRGEPRDQSLVGRKIADAVWSVYASRAYVERHGRPEADCCLNGHFVIGCDGAIANYPGARWARSVTPPAAIATRSDSWQGLMLAVKAGAGLAAMPRWQAENEDLVRVIDDIGVSMPYYLLMHRDMQHTPRVRAFADFVATEMRVFRKILRGG